MIQRVIVAGGGTGGHLFPGLAVVEELRRRIEDLEVLFVGTARGIEARVLPALGEKIELMKVIPLKGRTPRERLKGAGAVPGAVWHGLRIARRFRPDLVIGVGGYAAGPMLAAAAALGIPTAVLEQNAHVGLTNRILSRLVGRAYVTFPETAGSFRAGVVRVFGNPVRRAFVDAARKALGDPDGFDARGRSVLVVGGSQGAGALNDHVPAALALAQRTLGPFDIVHQTGLSMHKVVEQRYAELGVKAEVTPFIEDMARATMTSALVVSRAGATSVAELCAIGRASVLVPFPHAADDHQTKNAQSLGAVGASVCVAENELGTENLAKLFCAILGDEGRRTRMARAARALGRPDAAAAIVDDLCDWLGHPARPASGTDRGDASSFEPTSDDGSADGSPEGGASGAAGGSRRSYLPRSGSLTPPGMLNRAPVFERPAIPRVFIEPFGSSE